MASSRSQPEMHGLSRRAISAMFHEVRALDRWRTGSAQRFPILPIPRCDLWRASPIDALVQPSFGLRRYRISRRADGYSWESELSGPFPVLLRGLQEHVGLDRGCRRSTAKQGLRKTVSNLTAPCHLSSSLYRVHSCLYLVFFTRLIAASLMPSICPAPMRISITPRNTQRPEQ